MTCTVLVRHKRRQKKIINKPATINIHCENLWREGGVCLC